MRGNSEGLYPAGSKEGRKFFLGHHCYWKVPCVWLVEAWGGGGEGGENRSQHEGRWEGSLGPIE